VATTKYSGIGGVRAIIFVAYNCDLFTGADTLHSVKNCETLYFYGIKSK
jgi:hypothetical protein